MGIGELMAMSMGLAMDALAVAICKGLAMSKMQWKQALIIALYFGGFQAMMPCLGFFLGIGFHERITNIDHWLAFILLATIGTNMIREAWKTEEESIDDSIEPKVMIPLAIATSIDALAVGVTFAFFQVNITQAAIIIGVIACIIALVGVKIGNVFGNRYEKKAQLTGGIILILLGTKILLEHLYII